MNKLVFLFGTVLVLGGIAGHWSAPRDFFPAEFEFRPCITNRGGNQFLSLQSDNRGSLVGEFRRDENSTPVTSISGRFDSGTGELIVFVDFANPTPRILEFAGRANYVFGQGYIVSGTAISSHAVGDGDIDDYVAARLQPGGPSGPDYGSIDIPWEPKQVNAPPDWLVISTGVAVTGTLCLLYAIFQWSGSIKKKVAAVAALLLPLTLYFAGPMMIGKSTSSPETASNSTAVFKTTKGDITMKLFPELAPKTVENFSRIFRQGFYDGKTFDADSELSISAGNGAGYTLDYEPTERKLEKGCVAMHQVRRELIASGNEQIRNSGSHFFILDGYQYSTDFTIFAEVVSGMDVVSLMTQSSTEGGTPLESIKIISVEIQ